MTTIVTGLFDINRVKLDGRSWESYLTWFEKTLSINSPMVIFVEEKTYDFVKSRRNDKHTKIIVKKLNDLDMYKYKNDMDDIIKSDSYKIKIKDSNRIECKNSLYTIIQFSKFDWMSYASLYNPFNSDYFIWMDAGLSRFFDELNTSNSYPSIKNENELISYGNKVFIQTFCRSYPDLFNSTFLGEEYLCDNRSFVMGGLFGGNKNILPVLRNKIHEVFDKLMLHNNIINNEQIVLGYIYKNSPNLFVTFVNDNIKHRSYEIINILAK